MSLKHNKEKRVHTKTKKGAHKKAPGYLTRCFDTLAVPAAKDMYIQNLIVLSI